MRYLLRKKGQVTVEVVLIWCLFVAIVAALAYGLMSPGIQNVYSKTGENVGRAGAMLDNL